jgi:hypothetical protein
VHEKVIFGNGNHQLCRTQRRIRRQIAKYDGSPSTADHRRVASLHNLEETGIGKFLAIFLDGS